MGRGLLKITFCEKGNQLQVGPEIILVFIFDVFIILIIILMV